MRIDSGRARVTLRLDHEFEGKIFKDATATVRPTSALQTLIVNIDPGTPARGELEAGDTIPPARTGSFVHIDELTAMLDADTQAQVQVLIRELAGALDGREPELRRIVAELGRLTDGATPLAEALSDRRVLLRRLTDNLDVMLTTLGDRGDQLAAAVDARQPHARGDRAPLARRSRRRCASSRRCSQETRLALAREPPAGRAAVAGARPADPGRPTTPAWPPRGCATTLPALDRFVDAAGRRSPATAAGRRACWPTASSDQAELIRNDQTPALQGADRARRAARAQPQRRHPVRPATSAASTSVNRRAGTYGQFDILNFETSPEAFGFGRVAPRRAERRAVAARPRRSPRCSSTPAATATRRPA